jgi:hypothetical protein
MRRTLALVAAIVMTLGLSAGPALAQHPTLGAPNQPVIDAHQHYVNGQRVGPNSCENGTTLGSDHFHLNAHLGRAGNGALHRLEGLDVIVPGGC